MKKLGRKYAQGIPTDDTLTFGLSVWFAHHVGLFINVFGHL
jgi:hypothetical protein